MRSRQSAHGPQPPHRAAAGPDLPRAGGSGFHRHGAECHFGGLTMLENQIALITGASRGIGNAIALALGAAGARVIGTATSEEGAARVGASLASHGYNGRGALLDAADSASIDALMAQLDEASELPTILIN